MLLKHSGSGKDSLRSTTQGMSGDSFKLHGPLELEKRLTFHKPLGLQVHFRALVNQTQGNFS